VISLEVQYGKWYSPALERDMEWKSYGHGGKPVLFIPCQDGRFFDFEDFGMADVWAPWIESGQVTVFSIDTIDAETWSNKGGDPGWRAWRYEQWIAYIVEEMVPFMVDRTGCPGIMAFGCSLGATHAANLYFRFPEIFDRLLALSGIYTADYGFDGYMDDVVYRNSPVHYLAGLSKDHPYIQKYNANKGVICVGQGAWEAPETTCRIRDLCGEKGIHLWVDLWGYDVNHDWPWWYKQVAYFLPYLLDQA
jgi:esterase/lipase superfamily enzyme